MLNYCLSHIVSVLGRHRSFLLCLFIAPFTSSVVAFEYDANQYSVYLGDLDGNDSNMYFLPKEQIILLHGEIVTPILIERQDDYQVVREQNGFESDYTPRSQIDSGLIDQGISDGNITLLEQNDDYYIGDFDGDGSEDYLVLVGNRFLIMVHGGNDFSIATMVEGIDEQDLIASRRDGVILSGSITGFSSFAGALGSYHNIFDGTHNFIVRDVDGDGRDELFLDGGEQQADYSYSFEENVGSLSYSYTSNSKSKIVKTATLNGASSGSFRVNEQGAATYSLPILLPEGTAGVAPSVSLNYSSGAGRGVAGIGWNLSGISSISRCRQTLMQDGQARPITWSSEDRFCLDGQRLVVINGLEYGALGTEYKTETDSFVRVTQIGGEAGHPNHFSVEARDGTVAYYGNSIDSRQDRSSSDNKRVLAWHITRKEDSVGNGINYLYEQDDANDIRVQKISYAYVDSIAHAVVDFTYESRPDISSIYVAGENFTSTSRLRSIDVSNNAGSSLENIRTYNLAYVREEIFDTYKTSRLGAVQECVKDECLPATEFKWEQSSGYDFSYDASSSLYLYGSDNILHSLITMDINGDSLLDVAWIELQEHYGDYRPNINYALFDPVSREFVRTKFYGVPIDEDSNHPSDEYNMEFGEDAEAIEYAPSNISAIDYNGDGRQDLVYYSSLRETRTVYLSEYTPAGVWRISTAGIVLPIIQENAVPIDANSDGLSDFMSIARTYILTRTDDNASTNTPFSYVEEINEWPLIEDLGPVDWAGPQSGNFFGYEYGESDRAIPFDIENGGDFDGDGVQDVIVDVFLPCVEFNGDEEFYDVNAVGYEVPCTWYQSQRNLRYAMVRRGNAFEPYARLPQWDRTGVSFSFPNVESWVNDVNGDSLSDVITRVFDPDLDKNTFYLRINTGQGFLPQVEIAEYDDSDRLSPTFLDLNGDGASDISFKEDSVHLWDMASQQYDSNVTYIDNNVPAFSNNSRVTSRFFSDYTGDLHPDYILISAGSRSLKVYENANAGINNIISEVKNGLGGVTKISYELLSKTDSYKSIEDNLLGELSGQASAYDPQDFYQKLNKPFEDLDGGSHSLSDYIQAPVFQYFSPVYVVTRIDSSAPAGNVAQAGSVTDSMSAIEYEYSEAKIQAGGRGFLGFKSLKTTDLQRGIETETFYRQDWPFIGVPLQTASYAPDGSLMSIEYMDWWMKGASGDVWSESWVAELNANNSGISPVVPLQVFIRESNKVTYEYSTSVDDPTQIVPVDDEESSVVFCKLGSMCPSAASGSSKYLQRVSLLQNFDKYGNLYTSTSVTEGKGLSIIKTISNDYDGDSNYSTQSSGDDITFADGRVNSGAALGRLSNTKVETTRSGNPKTTRESAFEYVTSGVKAGLLKREIVEPNDSSKKYKVTTLYGYDDYGNKISTDTSAYNQTYEYSGLESSVSLLENRKTTYEFDETKRYVALTKTHIGNDSFINEEVVSRNGYGAPLQIASRISDHLTDIEYDVLGRESRRSDNAGAWGEVEYLASCGGESYCPLGTSFTVKKIAAGGGVTLSFYDVLGRAARIGSQSFDGRIAYVDTEYDNLGRTLRVSDPYFIEGINVEPKVWTTNTYDVLDRIVETVSPDNTSQKFRYEGYSTAITNALNNVRTVYKNGLGELERVVDPIGGVISYEYNERGDLSTVRRFPIETGMPTLVTSIVYDDFGRKLSMVDLDKGSWEYKYNGFGELVWQEDAKGQVVTQEYDLLGRIYRRTDFTTTGTVENHTRWYFDENDDAGIFVPNAKLKATAIVMTESKGQETCASASARHCSRFTYDNLGRIETSEVQLNAYGIDLGTYTTRVEYDDIGRILQTYDALDGVVMSGSSGITSGTENKYNEYGFLESVIDLRSQDEIYTITEQNARGQVLESLGANGVTNRNTYDPLTGRLLAKNASIDPQDLFTVQHVDYSWDGLGNLTSRHNSSGPVGQQNNQSEYFCYDNLNRLIKTYNEISSKCSDFSEAQQDIRYGSLGNILYKEGVGDYSYGVNTASPYYSANKFMGGSHALTYTSDGIYFDYDANGNMVSDTSGRSLEYSTFDKPKKIEKGNHTTEFAYGPSKSRYWRRDTNSDTNEVTTIIYLGGVERIIVDDEITWRRDLGGFAQYEEFTDLSNVLLPNRDTEKSFIYKDHLGSVDVLTDIVGTVTDNYSFDAWGARRDPETLGALSTNYSIAELVLPGKTTKGFTGHEMLDELGLIHMNGRIYDPRLARFMQADPYIQASTNTQSYNRYSYLWNNPLNATDPSGYKIRWESWRKGAEQVIKTVIVMVVSYYNPAAGAYIAGVFALGNGATYQEAAFAAFSSYVMGNVSSTPTTTEFGRIAMATTMGVYGGVTSVLAGGKFGHGFAAGFIGSYAGSSPQLQGVGLAASLTRVGFAAALGGTSSAVSGGKFANGAASAAFYAAVSEGLRARGTSTDSIEEEEEEEEWGESEEFEDKSAKDLKPYEQMALAEHINLVKTQNQLVIDGVLGGESGIADILYKGFSPKGDRTDLVKLYNISTDLQNMKDVLTADAMMDEVGRLGQTLVTDRLGISTGKDKKIGLKVTVDGGFGPVKKMIKRYIGYYGKALRVDTRIECAATGCKYYVNDYQIRKR